MRAVSLTIIDCSSMEFFATLPEKTSNLIVCQVTGFFNEMIASDSLVRCYL